MSDIRSKAKRLILALYNVDAVYYASEKKNRVTEAELCIMYVLDDGKPHSQREIAQDWLVPKTTINTITKRWENEGLLTQTRIPGKRREMQITLTEAGKEYSKSFLQFVYTAQDKALKKTVDRYSDTFIEALEYFGASLKEAFEEPNSEGEDNSTAV